MRVLMVLIPAEEAIVTVEVDSESEGGQILRERRGDRESVNSKAVAGRATGRNVSAVALPPPDGEDN